ncbi:WD repeat-containing protein 26 [Cyphellophora attinorum]|uniref:Protein FYV10 n=1 Tax=Cyphellophora attinorum TaxID=1664694 RepID=A0A0N0NNQ2_9EURO|nr:WD repeat-containing protein 26 [Phialophora attinorum]KPI41851.1 WD repeat-containing protein 26 [Phialophora attinorum]
MRPEDSSTQAISNGHNGETNGASLKKALQPALNGHDRSATNGASFAANGATKKTSPVRTTAQWHGHNREEITRILIQGLNDLGYTSAADVLADESGFELESPSVAAFRSAVLDGRWNQAESILLGTGSGAESADQNQGGGLVLKEGFNRGQMLFSIREQKFLELLDQRELSRALTVLRTELTPLDYDMHKLHALSTLLMCPPEDLRSRAHWADTIEQARLKLLQDLSRSIAPSVMLREHRLAELFAQVKQAQINQCLYHNTSVAPSLYDDHDCSRDAFPLRTSDLLEDHSDEVWHVQFSPDGTMLASASKDKTALIYSVPSFELKHRLTDHSKGVTSLAWSPDSKKLITCSIDARAKVWNAETGRVISTFEHRTTDSYAITEAAWGPDSMSFVTGSHNRSLALCLWRMDSSTPQHVWEGGFRSDSVIITPDGRRMVVADTEGRLHCFNYHTYREEFSVHLGSRVTGISVSRDSSYVLLNLEASEVHMFDLEKRETVKTFTGQKQGSFMVRNCFGGAAENFVLSGSEDGLVYVWHKENTQLIEQLYGHGKGQSGKATVNTVDWNPVDPGMFASGGDDRKIRIWTNSVVPAEAIPGSLAREAPRHEISRTSAIRSTL